MIIKQKGTEFIKINRHEIDLYLGASNSFPYIYFLNDIIYEQKPAGSL